MYTWQNDSMANARRRSEEQDAVVNVTTIRKRLSLQLTFRFIE
jgi:hypothetical protein